MQDFKPPKPILPGECLNNAVYCSDCTHLKQDIVGGKCGTCFGHSITDSNTPMNCSYFKNDTRLISVFIFLKSGIPIYNKAIVKDLNREFDPSLLSSFLQAINMFGQELTDEQISLIKFQKMNVVYCRGQYANGAMIIKGDIHEVSKEVFTFFIQNLESSFPDFFKGEYKGICLPEDEVDKIAFKSMKKFFKDKLHTVSPEMIKENIKNLKCSSRTFSD